MTSKFQITIPREIRDRMKLGVSDVIEWNIDKDGIRLEPAEKPFLKFHGYFDAEIGSVDEDIQKARELRSARYQ